MTDRQAAEAREPLTEDEYDAEWERLYAILGDGDRDAMLRFALEEKHALSVRLAQAEQERDTLRERLMVAMTEDEYFQEREELVVRLREYEEAAEAVLAQDDWTDTVSVSYAAYKRLDALAASGGREAPKEEQP